MVKQKIRWQPLVLYALVVAGFLLRLYGLNWDQGNSFHPDEREIMFHVTVLAWPGSLQQFLNPQLSPLNPHFFAYGSFPLYLLALVGNGLARLFPSMGSFAYMTLVGRVLSALFDSGTIFLTGYLALLLARRQSWEQWRCWSTALLSAAFVTFTPFQLQLAHFYAVDTMLLFFVMLTLLGCVILLDTERIMFWSLVVGVAYGLALATKASAAPLAVPVVLVFILRWYRWHELFSEIISLVYTFLIALLTFFITQPYALLDMPDYIQQVAEQGSLVRGDLDLPFVRQFAETIPVLYQVQNMVLWGLGLTLGLSVCCALVWFVWQLWKRALDTSWLIVLFWVLVYGAINLSLYVKFMRYLLPIYPLLSLMAATFLLACVVWLQRKIASATRLVRWKPILSYASWGLIVLVLGGTIFQGLALLNIYSQPNTRIQLSRWMYAHVKPGSMLTYEQWDDPMPVAVDGNDPTIFLQATYLVDGKPGTGLDLYGPDTSEKAHMLANNLSKVDVITMPTDRLDMSIPRWPERYPLTIHYYQLLFSGQLGFHQAAQFVNYPHLLGITLDDSGADESYSVFDHPRGKIFVRNHAYTAQQLYDKLMQGIHLPL